MKNRIECDSLGEKKVSKNAYYGAQTQRAFENFPISGRCLRKEMITSLVLIKKAAAVANSKLGLLETRKSKAIIKACDEVLNGKFSDQFIVDVYQAGAGTSFNMNVNEVIANRANEILGAPKGSYRFIHPNDHVNMAQSTNDTFPTAMRLACLIKLPALIEAVNDLEKELSFKGKEFHGIIKAGRTHLQDAVPVSLGREFSAYSLAVKKSKERIIQAAIPLQELNLGGTAAGTGMNAHPRYRHIAIDSLNRWVGINLSIAKDMMERMQSLADFAALSSSLKIYSLELIRIANDIRLMSSGPNTGLAEISLPAVQPGSSIMPGKVNPVIAEMTDMVAFQVIGNDMTVAIACQAGQFELNVMMPVVAHNLLESMHILTNTTGVFSKRCISGIKADSVRCLSNAKRSLAIVTALAPKIGYIKAAEIAKHSLGSDKTISELAVESGLLSRSEALKILDPLRLSGLTKIANPKRR